MTIGTASSPFRQKWNQGVCGLDDFVSVVTREIAAVPRTSCEGANRYQQHSEFLHSQSRPDRLAHAERCVSLQIIPFGEKPFYATALDENSPRRNWGIFVPGEKRRGFDGDIYALLIQLNSCVSFNSILVERHFQVACHSISNQARNCITSAVVAESQRGSSRRLRLRHSLQFSLHSPLSSNANSPTGLETQRAAHSAALNQRCFREPPPPSSRTPAQSLRP
jgi:hypothetical protein